MKNSERIIDWNGSVDLIDRQVRCFSPKPGARTRLDGKWIKIVHGMPLSDRTIKQPGTLTDNGGLDVACGNGLLYRVLKVQIEGKKMMDSDAFLRGNPIRLGQSFDVYPD